MTVLPGHWPLINRVRDAGNLLTLEEKQHMHNLVTRYKRTGVIFAADLIWLNHAAENFGGVAPLYELLSKGSRRKGGARED
jgi:hypothetical protein